MLDSTYTRLIFLAVVAELFRRLFKVLIVGFTGPLSKVPGPFWSKISPLPWRLAFLRGTAFLLARDLHQKYGDIVRAGQLCTRTADGR
jgi:hypothetical protein